MDTMMSTMTGNDGGWSIEYVVSRQEMIVNGIDEELAVVDICGPYKDKDFPVKVETMVICLCIRGSGSIKIDVMEYDVDDRSLFCLVPRHFIAKFSASEDFVGKVIICGSQMMERILPKLTELIPLLIKNPRSPIMRLSKSEISNILEYYNLLRSKVGIGETPFKKKIVTYLLQSLLFEILDIMHKQPGNYQLKKSRKEQIMTNFIIAVAENFRTHRDVTYYADRLCITPKHLSAVVKEISGRPASEWIDQHVIMEAKVMLRSTSHTVQEIASLLNFANQSFFGKYFKHIVGLSPTAYRSSVL